MKRLRAYRQWARRVEPRVDLVTTVAALGVVPVVAFELWASDPDWLVAATRANWVIWLIFAFDFVVKLSAFGLPWLKTGGAWFEIAVVVFSYPNLGELLASARMARLTRLSRMTRAGRLSRVASLGRLLAVGRLLAGLRRTVRPAAFPYVAAAVIGTIVVGAVLFHLEESEAVSLGDALWWAAVTVTTVGYGDISPASTTGRAVALIVMLVGIGFTSLLTGQIAGFLASDGSDDVTSELRALREEVAGLRREVRRLDGTASDASVRSEALENQEVGQADPVEGRRLQSVGQGSEPTTQPG